MKEDTPLGFPSCLVRFPVGAMTAVFKCRVGKTNKDNHRSCEHLGKKPFFREKTLKCSELWKSIISVALPLRGDQPIRNERWENYSFSMGTIQLMCHENSSVQK